MRLASLDGGIEGGIVYPDKVVVVLRPVQVNKVINLLAWTGDLREGVEVFVCSDPHLLVI